MTYDEFARRCQKNGDSFMTHCPMHDDEKESLSVKRGDKLNYVVHCFAGCDPIEIKKRLEKDDFLPYHSKNNSVEKNSGKWIEYGYPDKNGELVMMVKRTPDKSFPQYQPDGKGGWKKGIKGISRLVLYNLPDIVQAQKEGNPVFFVEGEKDADNLKKLGVVATTSPMGAGKFRQEFVNQLAGVSAVYIIPDNDVPGRKHAKDVASKLAGHIPDIRIIELPVKKAKEDVSDWLESYGGTLDRLFDLVQKTPVYQALQPNLGDGQLSAEPELKAEKDPRYKIQNGQLSQRMFNKEEGFFYYVPIADLTASITKEVIPEFGESIFSISGQSNKGRSFEVEIESSKFEEPRGLKPALAGAAGADCIFYNGKAGHLAPAIKFFTKRYKKVQRFHRVGWHKDIFLMPGLTDLDICLPINIPFEVNPKGNLAEGLKGLSALAQAQSGGLTLLPIVHALGAPLARPANLENKR